jgi:hypothetical protein
MPTTQATSSSQRLGFSGPASVHSQGGLGARWFPVTAFATASGSEWPVRAVVEGRCAPHGTQNDACWALHGDGVQLVTLKLDPHAEEQPVKVQVLEQEGEVKAQYAPSRFCRVMETGTDLVRICDHYSGSPARWTGWRADRINTPEGTLTPERTFSWNFDGEPWPYRASLRQPGLLAFHGTCGGQQSDRTICVRNIGGVYEELRSPLPIPANAMVRSLFTPDGKMEVVARIPGDGLAFTFVLVRSSRVINFTEADMTRVDEQVSSSVGVKMSDRYPTCEPTSYDGQLLRYLCRWQSASAAVVFDLGTNRARVQASVGADGFGAFGLRVGQRGKIEESLDEWRTWTEVEGPPGGVPDGVHPACSRMGCTVGKWVRVGWSTRRTPPGNSAP